MKYLLIVIFGIFLSCSDTTSGTSAPHDLTTKSEVQDNSVTIVRHGAYRYEFEIIKIRDCQYVIYRLGLDRGIMCHLGDCDNPIHKK